MEGVGESKEGKEKLVGEEKEKKEKSPVNHCFHYFGKLFRWEKP